jgi:hypothetical protein
LVKLPPYPLREIEADESHPLVSEALRPRKPYELCWCGSGRKYKKCHRFRHEKQPYALGWLLKEQNKIFWKRRQCMHPMASRETCSGKIIDAHSIQRKGPIEKITCERNHVCRIESAMDGSGMTLSEIGWKKASTFPGYCSFHDTNLFSKLENVRFSGSHEQCVIQAFRNVCNELYKKQSFIESLRFQRDVIDLGCDIDEQISRQLTVYENIIGQEKSMQELSQTWNKFEESVTRNNYDKFSSKTFFFDGDLSVSSSGALHTEFDFNGNRLIDMWDLGLDAEMLSHSIMDTEEGGAIVFTWLTEDDCPRATVASFEGLADDFKGDIFVQYCFLNCENTYFSKAWWDSLDANLKNHIYQYADQLFYDGGAFVPNERRLVDWKFT